MDKGYKIVQQDIVTIKTDREWVVLRGMFQILKLLLLKLRVNVMKYLMRYLVRKWML